MSKVSILIPVFNREQFIAECIQSALDQTFTDFEVVLVDNNSNDGTWEICESFAAKDSRVRIFQNQTNIGPVRNWRRCAEEAKSEFCKILFSDDTLDAHCLAEMVPKLEDPDIAFVYCAARVGETMSKSKIRYAIRRSKRLSSNYLISLLTRGKASVSPGSILIRRKDFLSNLHTNFPTSTPRPFDRHGAGPDVMVLLLTLEKYKYVANIAQPLVYFRAHPDSFSIANSSNQINEGYDSAIAYYLFNKTGYFPWVSFVAKSWLRRIKKEQRWLNPTEYLMGHEGKDSFRDIFIMIVFAIGHVINYAFLSFLPMNRL
jgi:glycosyltransferase involved in cell wall biosynthesis